MGLLGAGAAFVRTLAPSAGTDAALPRVATSSIPPASFRFVPDIYEQRTEPDQVLLVRTIDGRLFAWLVPVREGGHRLPDYHWWKPGIPCHDFRPDFEAQVIRCFDAELPHWAQSRYRWRLDGKSLTDQAADMEAVPGVEESGYFVFHKRSAA
jgi:hypothetical protein